MGRPATGRALLFGLGVEQEFGVPGPLLLGYDPILAVTGGLTPTEADSGQVNRSGYLRPGLPGAKGGEAFEWGHPLTAGHLPEFFQHVLGSAEANGSLLRTLLEAGVHEYVFEPTLAGVETSFWGLLGKEPVERWLLYGIRFGSIALEIGDNAEIPVRLAGFEQHGSLFGPVAPAAGNTGTYLAGPHLRGLARDPSAGSLWARVESTGPLVFKVLQAPAAPAAGDWTAAAATFGVLVGSDGRARWQNVQSSATNLDLGVYETNKDPLELIWPGDAAAHADLAPGDVFEFAPPDDWQAPALALLSGHQRFTSAHWKVRVRALGAPAYDEIDVNSGSVEIAWPVETSRGNNSRYPFEIDRTGDLAPTLTLNRRFVDRFFADKLDRHERLDVQLVWEGQQLGASGLHREGVTIELPSAGILTDERQANDEGVIEETVNLRGETDDAGAAPVRVTVTTPRDWTPAV